MSDINIANTETVPHETSVDRAGDHKPPRTALLLAARKTEHDVRMLHATVKHSQSFGSSGPSNPPPGPDLTPVNDTIPSYFYWILDHYADKDPPVPDFNPDVPTHSYIGWINKMLAFIQGDPQNLKAPQVLLQFIAIVSANRPDIAAMIAKINYKGKPLLETLIMMQIHLRYFQEGGDYKHGGTFNPNQDQGSDQTFLYQLCRWFNNDTALGQQADQAFWNFQTGYSSFVDANSVLNPDGKTYSPQYSFNDWLQMATNELDGFNAGSLQTQLFHIIEKNLENIFGSMNPEEILAYLMAYMDGSIFDQEGFLGNNINWLKQRSTEMTALYNTWSAGHFDANSSQSFIQAIHDALFKYNHPNGDSIIDEIESSVGKYGFLNMQTAYKDSADKSGKILTVDDLFRLSKTNGKAYDSSGNAINAADALTLQLNAWNLQDDPKVPLSPQYTTIQTDFRTATTTSSDQGTQIGLDAQKVNSDEQADDNVLNNVLKMITDFLTDVIKRYAS